MSMHSHETTTPENEPPTQSKNPLIDTLITDDPNRHFATSRQAGWGALFIGILWIIFKIWRPDQPLFAWDVWTIVNVILFGIGLFWLFIEISLWKNWAMLKDDGYVAWLGFHQNEEPAAPQSPPIGLLVEPDDTSECAAPTPDETAQALWDMLDADSREDDMLAPLPEFVDRELGPKHDSPRTAPTSDTTTMARDQRLPRPIYWDVVHDHIEPTLRRQRHPTIVFGMTAWDADGNPTDELQPIIHQFIPGSNASVLVAGISGTGKSVLINSALLSLVLGTDPRLIQLVIVDPAEEKQGIDYQWLKDVPHRAHTITQKQHLPKLTERFSREAQHRTHLFRQASIAAGFQIDNLGTYNEVVHNHELPPVFEPLPYILTVVDEVYLVRQLLKPEEDFMSRLATAGRAAGLGLLLSTMYPTTNVLPSIITMNMTTIVALKMLNGTQSRVVLEGATYQPHLLPTNTQTRDFVGRAVIRRGTEEYIIQSIGFRDPRDRRPIIDTIHQRWGFRDTNTTYRLGGTILQRVQRITDQQ